MSVRFTLAGLLMWMTFIALVLAIVVPIRRHSRRKETNANSVTSIAASVDGSTFAALFGDGQLWIWDSLGHTKSRLHTRGGIYEQLAVSFDGRLAAVSFERDLAGGRFPAGVEIWDLTTSKVFRTISGYAASLAFSPTENVLCITNSAKHEIHSLNDDLPPRTIVAKGNFARFSCDGQRIAVEAGESGIYTYDIATQQLLQKVGGDQGIGGGFMEGYTDLAWTSDDSALIALQTVSVYLGGLKPPVVVADQAHAVKLWDLSTGKLTTGPAAGEDGIGTLAYLPECGVLAVATHGSPLRFLISKNLQTLDSKATFDVDQVAAGRRGKNFIASRTDSVDLWDGATLQPQRRLYETKSPNCWPPACGLVTWVIVFLLRLARKKSRTCRTQGDSKSSDRITEASVTTIGYERQGSHPCPSE